MKTRAEIFSDFQNIPVKSCDTEYRLYDFIHENDCKQVFGKITDYIQQCEREAVIKELKKIKKRACVCKIEFGTSADCDYCATEHVGMYEICEKLAELKGEVR